MADEFTTANGFGTPGDRPEPQPETRKQINGFTGEEEDAPALNLSASPTDQRILAAPPHTDPLPDLIHRAINGRDDDAGVDVENHVGPSLQSDALPGETPLPYIKEHDTPDLNNEGVVPVPVQHTDVPPPNDIIIDNGEAVATTEGVPYPGLDTKAFNDSVNARIEAKAEKSDELPDIEPPVPGDQVKPEPTPAPTEPAPAEETPTDTPAVTTPEEVK